MKKKDEESVKADMEESEYKESAGRARDTLVSFCEELATVYNTNNRGQWSNKRAAYTIAFDGGQDYHGPDSVSTTLRALCQYSTSQRKSPLAGIDSPESERVPLAMMPRKPSSVTL